MTREGSGLLGRGEDSLLCLLGEHADGVFGRVEATSFKDVAHGGADVAGFCVPLAKLLLVPARLFTAQQAAAVVVGGAGKKRLELVIIFLQDGVELMVVALGATVGQPHENRRDGV